MTATPDDLAPFIAFDQSVPDEVKRDMDELLSAPTVEDFALTMAQLLAVMAENERRHIAELPLVHVLENFVGLLTFGILRKLGVETDDLAEAFENIAKEE